MITAVRRLRFCAGHRILGHRGPCRHVHGHNYIAFAHAAAAELDELGMVVDFEVLDRRLGGWIREHWDHAFLLHREDAELRELLGRVPGQKLYLLDGNPTAENMAAHLLHRAGPEALAGTGVELVRVVLWETDSSYAEAALDRG